jgi:Flp pilus assembly protein TadG
LLQRTRERGQGLAEFALVIPLMFILAVAIGDFGRLFTAMIAVESAAREAADYGAFLGSDAWASTASPWPANETEMKRRACMAVSQLGDYDNTAGTCSNNPVVTWQLWETNPVTKQPDHVINPLTEDCGSRTGVVDPCVVHVTVTYAFHPIVPLPPVPDTLTIKRDAWFAVSDLVDTP